MEIKRLNLKGGKSILSRAELKAIMGGKVEPTDNNPTANCSPSGCQYSCYVTCDDSNGNPGSACATYAICG